MRYGVRVRNAGSGPQLRAHSDRLAGPGSACITVCPDSAEVVAALLAAPSDAPPGP